jgi:outer membrane protein assembly factor BamC
VKSIIQLTVLGTALALAGCSVLESDKVDYRSSAVKAPSLVVPPDLTQLAKDTRYTVVDGGVSASGYKPGQAALAKAPVAATALGDVRIERSGNQRWLVVKRPVDKLWEPVKDFWQESGFLLAMDQASLGIMETDWAENRAKIPQDLIRNSLGKLFDSFYSTAERDKFRTRLETNAAGETEIFISHRGVIEVYTKERSDQTVWQPRPSDPELEAEFLRRLMISLGSTPEQAKALVSASGETKSLSSVSSVDGRPVVQIAEGFDRAWRRVGLALDRTGFTVEDRDRKQGLYFVRYVATDADSKAEPGFFSKLFSSTPAKSSDASKYQIAVKSQGENTVVSILNAKGVAETSATAQRIAKVIADDIKQ